MFGKKKNEEYKMQTQKGAVPETYIPAAERVEEKEQSKLVKFLTSEIISYLIVGVLTTMVSWGAYAAYKYLLLQADVDITGKGNELLMQIGVILRWIAGVLFAYVTNRKFVFHSKNKNIWKEFVGFTSSRVITLFMDMVIMWFLPSVLHWNDWVATFTSAVLVTVTNYIFSKFFVFRKKKEKKKDDEKEVDNTEVGE